MKNISLAYGDSTFDVILPEKVDYSIFTPPNLKGEEQPVKQVGMALENPIGNKSLDDFVGCKSCAIAINDKTRPVPLNTLLPPLLSALSRIGLQKDQIKILIGTGTHKPMPKDEFPRLIPTNIINDYQVFSHNCDNEQMLAHQGVTSRGTPIRINRLFIEADLKISVGNIEPHHFMGFSGGAKGVAIGLGGRETITRNHALISDQNAKANIYEKNPMRQEIEEIADIIGVDFVLNSVLNHELELTNVFFGDPRNVMRSAIPFVRKTCLVPAQIKYDLVIASAGGYPKDINLYQAQKAMTHAAMFARPGGIIILVAECREGIGSNALEDYMKDVPSYAAFMKKMKLTGFKVGPHKAMQVGLISEKNEVVVVSEVPKETLEKYFVTPCATIDDALSYASNKIAEPFKIAILPYATHTIPDYSNSE